MNLALLGDIALFGKMSIRGNPSINDHLSEIADYLKEFDYVVGNLETPFSVKKKTYGAKSAYICSDIDNVQLLKRLRINAVTLANNHMFDYGKEGYETTKAILQENGIDYFGSEGKELEVEIDGNKLAFSGFCCYTSNPLQCVRYGEYGVNAYSIPDVQEVIRRNNSNGYFNIVAVHAGLEHVNYPSIEHVRAARKIANDTPYVYYGHHPHVVQGVEEYNGSLIAHSLGNFCFDDVYTDKSSEPLVTLSENNRTGMILELTIDNNKIVTWKEQPIYISNNGMIRIADQEDIFIKYNKELENCDNDVSLYSSNRNKLIFERLSERKANRNFSWYLKRLRLRYLQLILNGKYNKKQYESNVLNYL